MPLVLLRVYSLSDVLVHQIAVALVSPHFKRALASTTATTAKTSLITNEILLRYFKSHNGSWLFPTYLKTKANFLGAKFLAPPTSILGAVYMKGPCGAQVDKELEMAEKI